MLFGKANFLFKLLTKQTDSCLKNELKIDIEVVYLYFLLWALAHFLICEAKLGTILLLEFVKL
jgi:hypothetical protein